MAEMRESMPNEEYVAWGAYHGRRAQRAELEAQAAKGKG